MGGSFPFFLENVARFLAEYLEERDDVREKFSPLLISLLSSLIDLLHTILVEPQKIYVYINYGSEEVNKDGNKICYTSVAIFPPYPSYTAKRHTALLARFFIEKGFSYRDSYADKELSRRGYHFLEVVSNQCLEIDIRELLNYRKRFRIPYLDIFVFELRRSDFWDLVEKSI